MSLIGRGSSVRLANKTLCNS